MSAGVELPGTGRYVRRPVAATLGLIMAVLIVGTVIVVVESFAGAFTDYVAVRAILPAGANAPQLGSPVEYRNVTVGKVAGAGVPVGNGQVSIDLHMIPSEVGAVPASVRATVGPLSIFGNQYVDLQPLEGTGGPAVHAGELIGAIPAGPSASLQATIADFYDVLKTIQPAQLDSTLTAFATALRGQGASLGTALHQASDYLDQMIPLLPTLERDLRLLSPVAGDLRASTPALLGLISNLTTTSATLVHDETAVHGLFAGGAGAAGEAAALVAAITPSWEHLLADSGPLLQDISSNANEVTDVLSGLDRWSKAWTAAESHGPYLSLSASISVPNAADLVLAALGAPDATSLFSQGLGPSLVDPPTYTAADCPSYGSEAGTDCGGASASTTAAQLGGPAQEQAAASITAGVTRGGPTTTPAVDTLLLGPVLNAMEHGS